MQMKFNRFSDFDSLKSAKNTIKSSKQSTPTPHDELKAMALILRKSIRKAPSFPFAIKMHQ